MVRGGPPAGAAPPTEEQLAKNRAAAARYRARNREADPAAKSPDQQDLDEQDSPPWRLQKSGRPPAMSPGKRTKKARIQEYLDTVDSKEIRGGVVGGQTADPSQYNEVVMAACRDVPWVLAARVGFVVPRDPSVVHQIGRLRCIFPALRVCTSRIEGAGAGVYAVEKVCRLGWLCEYGGGVVDRPTARSMRAIKEDTHLRGLYGSEFVLDGRLTESMRMKDFTFGYNLGSFVNGAGRDKTLQVNCAYVNVPTQNGSGVQRTLPSGRLVYVMERCFLRATRDILAGEELLVSYGSDYCSIHLDD